MSKAYRLKKDLPDFKKGTGFYEMPNGNYYITERNYHYLQVHPDYSGCHYADDPTYHCSLVENNPEWFEEIKEDEDKIIWQDDDIIYAWQTGNTHWKHGGTAEAFINYMKNVYYKTHQPKEDKPEWEIVQYEFLPLSVDRRFLINNTSKHWKDAEGNSDYKIHSVKRLSDNIVFSVGDEEGNEKIVSFWIEGKDMMAKLHGEYGTTSIPIRGLSKKSKPKEELKEPERIEVYMVKWSGDSFVSQGHNKPPYQVHEVLATHRIPKEKLKDVAQAIEQVLNDDGKNELVKQVSPISYVNMRGEKCYTQEQVNKMMEDERKKHMTKSEILRLGIDSFLWGTKNRGKTVSEYIRYKFENDHP